MKVVHKLLQDGSAGGVSEFFEGFVFDLADSFTGDLEDVSHFLQGAVIAVVDAKAQADDPFLACGEGFQNFVHLFFQEGAFCQAFGADDGSVFDKVA